MSPATMSCKEKVRFLLLIFFMFFSCTLFSQTEEGKASDVIIVVDDDEDDDDEDDDDEEDAAWSEENDPEILEVDSEELNTPVAFSLLEDDDDVEVTVKDDTLVITAEESDLQKLKTRFSALELPEKTDLLIPPLLNFSPAINVDRTVLVYNKNPWPVFELPAVRWLKYRYRPYRPAITVVRRPPLPYRPHHLRHPRVRQVRLRSRLPRHVKYVRFRRLPPGSMKRNVFARRQRLQARRQVLSRPKRPRRSMQIRSHQRVRRAQPVRQGRRP